MLFIKNTKLKKIKHYIKNIGLLLAFITITGSLKGQSFFIAVNEEPREDNFDIHVQNLNFFKNNEYFNDIVKGYTLLGYWAQAYAEYSVFNELKLVAGGHILKYHGQEKYSKILPVLRAYYAPNSKFAMVLGSTFNNENHYLSDPIFDAERRYTNFSENGLQFFFNHHRIETDLWLSWLSFIEENDPFQEELYTGISSNIHAISKKRIEINFPLQGTIYHKGGQINQGNDTMQTIMNGGIGMEFILRGNENNKLKHLGIKGMAFGFKDNSPSPKMSFENGYGYSLSITTKFDQWDFWLDYWRGYQFISALGDPIYQSISRQGNHVEENRELLCPGFRFRKTLGIKSGTFNLCYLSVFEKNYYDFYNQSFDYFFGLELMIDFKFL